MNDEDEQRQGKVYEEHLGTTVRVEVGGEDRKRSLVGVELIRELAAEEDRVFTTERARELCSRVDLKESYLLEALHHLSRNGWIVSLRRGLYAISLTVPGVSVAHEFEVAMHLVDPAAISHWSAMQYHGLTDQMPGRVFVLTTTESSVPRARGRKADQAPVKKRRPTYPMMGMVSTPLTIQRTRMRSWSNPWKPGMRWTWPMRTTRFTPPSTGATP